MGRQGRSLFGLMLVGAGAVALYLWRNRRVRDYARALLAPASDCVRDMMRRALRYQVPNSEAAHKSKPFISGLSAPEVRPLCTAEQLLTWRPDPGLNPDEPFCRTYNAPLLLPTLTPPPPGHASLPGPTSASPSPSMSPTLSPAPSARPPGDTRGGGRGGWAVNGGLSAGGGGGGPPRLLVCHDMMGGYLADRLVQGAADPGAFRMWQWDQVDVFVYFSHHLVTIPPPGWVAAAHRNGVRVLGTLITEEWAAGRAMCESVLFASPAAARRTADQLAAIASTHGFDGWLLNIENGVRREVVPHLSHFAAYLRARMKAAVGPHAMVVWYDAMTTEGLLAWQNGLTRRNAPFFDATDALFVNYTWREGAPAEVAAAAGSRAAEVYLGVDVFGRGSYGGGKFNCPVALAAARSAGVSAALFAPGWVFEEFDRAAFEARQETFWAAIRAVWPPRAALLQRLPLTTTFNCGAGRGVWVEGRRVSSAPWHNLTAQDTVAATTPDPEAGAAAAAEMAAVSSASSSTQALGAVEAGAAPCPALRVRTTQQLAFSGGSCLALTLSQPPPAAGPFSSLGAATPPGPAPLRGPWTHTLYTAHVPVPASGVDLSYTAACSGTSRVAVLLRLAPASGATTGPARAAGAAAAGQGQGHGQGREGGPPAAPCGLAVGPWGAGDRQVVDALKRAGFTCVACAAIPTGTTTAPLPDPLNPTAGVAVVPPHSDTIPATTLISDAPALPSGLPWVSYSANLPASMLAADAGISAAVGVVVTAVGLVCYRTAVGGVAPLVPAAAAPGAAATAPGPAPGGKASGRGSTFGSGAVSAASVATAATAAALAAAVSSSLDSEDDRLPYRAFLGRLVLREHDLAGSSSTLPLAGPQPTAAGTDSPSGVEAAAAAAPPPPPAPLARGRCSRIRWSRPGSVSRPRSLRSQRSSFTGLGALGRTAAAGAAATAAAGTAGSGVGSDPRASEELVEGSDDDDDFNDDYEEWDLPSEGGGGGGFGGGSPIKAALAAAVAAASAIEAGAVFGSGDDDRSAAGVIGPSAGVDDGSTSRLLTCELSWQPQFDGYGMPRHRSYHVWAYFGKDVPPMAAGHAGGRPGGAPWALPAPWSPEAAAPAHGGGREHAWELLHPDWSSAVWAGEAFVARYRLVQLEVPGWAAAVTLLVQPVGWQGGELQPMQPLACLAVPPL